MYYLSSPNYCSFCRHQRNEGTESSGRAPRRHHGGPETVHRESLPPDPHKVRSATDETDRAMSALESSVQISVLKVLGLLKGHGHYLSQILFFCLYFLKYFSNAKTFFS